MKHQNDQNKEVPSTLTQALDAMGEHLPGNPDQALLGAREASRLMAIRILRGRFEGGKAQDLADDIAQECASRLNGKMQTREKLAQLRADADSKGKPRSGDGSPLNAYLHQIVRFTVIGAIRSQCGRLKRPSSEDSDKPQLKGWPKKVIPPVLGEDDLNGGRKLARRSRILRAVEIHDAYLESKRHDNRPLREVFGDWSPMKEWTGHCNLSDRPKIDVIPQRSLQRCIEDIRSLIKKDSKRHHPDDPSL